MNICSKGAIAFKEDESGFLYPYINEKLCINCGMCQKVCGFKNEEKPEYTPKKVYAAYNKNPQLNKTGSSGGIFFQLAADILSKGGVVYGAAFDDGFVVCHKRVDDKNNIKILQGSKYVQSRLEDTFKLVKNDLDNKIKVLFSGTGCQIDGLKRYLGRPYDNLITIDIICRGVPSAKMFEDYKSFLKSKYGGNITSVNFRRKKLKGEIQDIEVIFDNGKVYNEYPDFDVFRSFYGKKLSLRPSCYECKYACSQRSGDITIGDFWGIEKTLPQFKSPYGTSLLLANTQKGKDILESISEDIELTESTLENALQPSLTKCADKPENYDEFTSDYIKYGFNYLCKKYKSGSDLKKLLRKTKRLLK